METKENKYNRGKIYRIHDIAYTKFYYGSTVQQLSVRMGQHRSHYRMYQGGLLPYTTVYAIFDEFGVDNCKVELVENYPCHSREELEKQEGYHIQLNCCVNKITNGRTQKEYKRVNADRIKKLKKEYANKNKHKIKDYMQSYYNRKGEKIRDNCAAYRERNKEVIRERKT